MKIRKSILSILLVLCMLTQVFPSNLSILSAEEPADNDTEFVLEEETVSEEIAEVIPEEVFFEETEVTEENPISVEEISEEAEVLEESNIVEEESSEEVFAAEEISEAVETPVFTEEAVKEEVVPVFEKIDLSEVNMPKFFSGNANGLTVLAVDENEAFPKGTEMKVTAVDAAALSSLMERTFHKTVKNIQAVDISFHYDGMEIEPNGSVRITLNGHNLSLNDNRKVVHIDDNYNVQVISDARMNADGLQFEASGFSIYAIVDFGEQARLSVSFYHNDSLLHNTVVKANDNLDEAIFDPGLGEMEENEIFRGWTTDVDYNADTTALTIAEVREMIAEKLANGVNDGEEMNFHAMIYHAFYITYQDEKGVIISTDEMVSKDTQVSYTVNMPYTPMDANSNFEGWMVVDSDPMVICQNEEEISLTEDLVLRPYAPRGYWLSFEENGRGASYTAPQFILNGEVTQRPADPNRFGYRFGGWYTNEECTDGNEFNFGAPISERTSVYAKWIALEEAHYTVLIWKQNVKGTDYDFEEAVNLTGAVGTEADSVSKMGSGTSAYARVNRTDKKYMGFYLDHFDEEVIIATEGNSVVNVYYNRMTITLQFNTYKNGWKEYKTMSGLYGSTLEENGFEWPGGYDWYASGDNRGNTSGTRTTFLDAFLPSDGAETVKFYGSTPKGSATIKFYKQNAEGTGYVLANTVTANGGNFYISDKYNGFTAYQYSKDGGNWKSVGNKASNGYYNNGSYVSYSKSLEIRFNRDKYAINFMDGAYVNGNNVYLDEIQRGQLKEVDNVTYGADVSSYNKGGKNYYAPTMAGYAFAGWYTDEKCTQAYTFDTMTEGGITVYAKWVQVQYRVFLHPNVDASDKSLQWGQTNQSMSFRIDYNNKLSEVAGSRAEYELIGWYLDPSCTKVFNADSYPLNDSNTAAYSKSESTEVDAYGNPTENRNADADRFWITRKLDLYAKWRSILVGANGINVEYDANGGSNAPTDATLYADRSAATAGAASTPSDNNQMFAYWVVQSYNGTAFEDTELKLYPGQTFEVLKANSKQTANEDNTPDHPSYTYTVRLRAEYAEKGSDAETVIRYNANGGSFLEGTVTLFDQLKVNEEHTTLSAETISREHYRFLGWALDKDAETADFAAGVRVAADNLNPTDNILYAVWQPELSVRVEGEKDTREYNGKEQNFTSYTVTYILGGEESTAAPSGVSLVAGNSIGAKGEDAGTYPMNLSKESFTLTVEGNYFFEEENFTVTDGSLTITKKAVVFEGESDSRVYTGSEISLTEVSTEGLIEGQSHNVTYLAKGTEAGEYTGMITAKEDVRIEKDGKDVTANYDITVVNGTLVITKAAKATVTITGNTAEKVYNGKEQSVAGYTTDNSDSSIQISLKEDVKAEAKGTNAGEYPMGLSRESFTVTSENYEEIEVIVIDGKLIITPSEEEVTVTISGNTASKIYNGEEQMVEGFTTDIEDKTIVALLKEGHKAEARGINAGEYAMGLTEEDFTVSSLNYTNIKVIVKDGKLTITPVTEETVVTITGNSDSKVYNGSEQMVEGFTTDIQDETIIAELKADAKAEAKGTNAGEYAMGLTEEDFAVSSINYTNINVIVKDGKLTITPVTDETVVTITGNSDSKIYNGEEQTVEGFTTDIQDETIIAELNKDSKAEAKGTDAGEYAMGLSAEDFTVSSINYTNIKVIVNDGKLVITPIEDETVVTITGNSDSKIYNGEEQMVEGFTTDIQDETIIAELKADAKAEAKGTNAGEYAMGLTEEDFTVSSINYTNIKVIVNDGKLVITPIDQLTVTINGNVETKVYNQNEQTVTGYTTDVRDSSVTVELKEGHKAEARGTNAGEYAMGLTAEDFNVTSENYSSIRVIVNDGKLVITPIEEETVVTITGNSDSKIYNGEEQMVEGFTTDIQDATIIAELKADSKAEAKGTNAGEYAMGLSAEDFTVSSINYSNIKVVVIDGKLTITPIEEETVVTITGNSDSKIYNGEEQMVEGFTTDIQDETIIAELKADAKAEAKGTDAGEYQMGLTEEDFAVSSINYSNIKVIVNDGKLVITPIEDEVIVTITGNKDSKVYNGEEQMVEGYTAESSNALYSLDSYSFSGEAVAKGIDAGEYPMGLSAEDFRNENANFTNVRFVINEGGLTITPIEDEVIVKINGNTISEVYDGNAHLAEGYEAEIAHKLYKEADFRFTGEAKAEQTDAGKAMMNLSAEQFENLNKNFANVTFHVTDGYAEVTKRDLTLSSKSASKYFDGDELFLHEVEAEGFVNGEGASYEFANSIRYVGTIENEFTFAMNENTKEENYNITVSFGTLEILSRKNNPENEEDDPELPGQYAVTVKANSNESVYNAEEQNAEGFETLTFEKNGHIYTVTELNASVAAVNAGEYINEIKGEAIVLSEEGVDVTTEFKVEKVNGMLNILRAKATIAAEDKSKAYGAADPELTAVVSGLLKEDAVAYSLEREAGEAAGTYAIRVNAEAIQNNYEVEVRDAILTITAPAPTPTPEEPTPSVEPTPRPTPTPSGEDEPTVTPAEEIVEPETPAVEPTEEIIEEEDTPMAVQGAWALINLLSAIATTVVGLGMVIIFFRKKDEDEEEEEEVKRNSEEEEEEEENKRKSSKLLGILPAVASIITFILTEDMTQRMVLVDKWTLIMVIMLAVNALAAYFTRNRKEEKEEQEEARA